MLVHVTLIELVTSKPTVVLPRSTPPSPPIVYLKAKIRTTTMRPPPAATYPASYPAIISSRPIGCNLGEKRDDSGMCRPAIY
ncbi:hypothetical protein M0802_011254 [Mischocyttarus mexicanus]|nr:hypothetical protein M0802_011254 [Mischocyttarus mexicanus]